MNEGKPADRERLLKFIEKHRITITVTVILLLIVLGLLSMLKGNDQRKVRIFGANIFVEKNLPK